MVRPRPASRDKGCEHMIYCVEDETGIRELELYALAAAGFEARGFADAGAFSSAIGEEIPDLVVLDVMLPDRNGVEILRELRATPATARVPVIMATARGEEYEKISILDLGADDYLVKPFSMLEMVSRVRAVLRRSGVDRQVPVIRCGALEIDPRNHVVRVGSGEVELTAKEFRLLFFLLSRPGEVCTRDLLLAEIWGQEAAVDTRTVDVHVASLRKKLGASGEDIETVRGFGYRIRGK